MPPSLTRHPSIVDSSPWMRKRRTYLVKASPPVLLTMDQDRGASLFVLFCAPHMDKRENLSIKQDCTSLCFLVAFLFWLKIKIICTLYCNMANKNTVIESKQTLSYCKNKNYIDKPLTFLFQILNRMPINSRCHAESSLQLPYVRTPKTKVSLSIKSSKRNI
jgi:hypothetical protein